MTSAITQRQWMEDASAWLATGPHPERARRDAELLLLHVLGKDRAFLIAHGDEILDVGDADRLQAFAARRMSGEPIQYIAGEAEFYGLPFRVTCDVLIPRPETEHAVEEAIELAARFPAPRIVDVGTGSGAIAVALARRLPDARITATDVSPAALGVAQGNAARNHVPDRIRFFEGDLLASVAAEQLAPVGGGQQAEQQPVQFDIVVSNPPYIAESDRASLSIEVREFEPPQALFAGEDGLAIYRRLIPQAFAALARGGWIVLEIGCGQEPAVRRLLEDAGFSEIGFTPDLQGIPRVAAARRPA